MAAVTAGATCQCLDEGKKQTGTAYFYLEERINVWLGNSKLSLGPWMKAGRCRTQTKRSCLGLRQLSARKKTGRSYAHSSTDGRKGKTIMAIYLKSEQYITCSAVPPSAESGIIQPNSICRYLMDSYGLNYYFICCTILRDLVQVLEFSVDPPTKNLINLHPYPQELLFIFRRLLHPYDPTIGTRVRLEALQKMVANSPNCVRAI
jgi:hypothetical protein